MSDKLLHEALEQGAGKPIVLAEVLAIVALAMALGVWGLLATTTAWLWHSNGLTWPVAAASGFVVAGGAALVVGAARAIEGRRSWREARAFAPPGTSPPEPKVHDPILVRAFAKPQLEAPRELQPDIILLAVRELWESGKLSRRQAMRLRLPGGQAISRAMWERLVGGYQVEDGRRKNGLLAEAGLVQRTSTNSWAWRPGLDLATVMSCFDVGGAGRAGDAQENPPVTLAEQRRQRWVEVGHDVERYLGGER